MKTNKLTNDVRNKGVKPNKLTTSEVEDIVNDFFVVDGKEHNTRDLKNSILSWHTQACQAKIKEMLSLPEDQVEHHERSELRDDLLAALTEKEKE